MGRVADLPHGWVGTYDDNEVEIVSTISDPPKLRLGVEADKLSGDDFNLAAVTGNLVRSDGRHEEYGGYRVGLSPDREGGALRLFVRDGNGNEKEIAYMDAERVVFHVPVSSGGGDHLTSSDGRFKAIMQEDSNFVVYDTKPPQGGWRAVWSWLTGKL